MGGSEMHNLGASSHKRKGICLDSLCLPSSYTLKHRNDHEPTFQSWRWEHPGGWTFGTKLGPFIHPDGLSKDCYTLKKKKKQKNSCFISKITLFGDLFIITAEIDLSQFVQFVGAYNLLQKQA